MVDFCQSEGVTRIAVGDVRDIQTGVSLGHVRRTRRSASGRMGSSLAYLSEKAARLGISGRVD